MLTRNKNRKVVTIDTAETMHKRVGRRLACLGISTLAVAVLAATAHIAPAQAAPAATASIPAANASAASSPASVDTKAVVAAAKDFTPGDVTDVAELAEAATHNDGNADVDVKNTTGGMIAKTDAGTLTVDKHGTATMKTEGAPAISMGTAGEPKQTRIVDGAVVQTEVAPATDVVTKATDKGVQMIAVLGNKTAPNRVKFPLTLPAGSKLVPQPDGSIAIMAETETAQPLPGETERINTAIDKILDPNTNSQVSLTDKQIAALDAIPAVKTRMVKQDQQIGVIKAPWAVDANGKPVPTRYEITAEGITQIVDVDENTAFPVVADPQWWEWALFAIKMLITVANATFAYALSVSIAHAITKGGGTCYTEKSVQMNVCFGGKNSFLGQKAGTTYGHTFVAASDPRENWQYFDKKTKKFTKKYYDLMQHEFNHTKQWRTYGPIFIPMYIGAAAWNVISGREAKGCGNLFEILADAAKGGYEC